jgi:hypothetical protein
VPPMHPEFAMLAKNESQMRKTFVLGMCFGLLIGYSKGCSTIEYSRPHDFPVLREIVVKVDEGGIRKYCKASPWNLITGGVLGCTGFDFAQGTYTIYTMSDLEWLMKHEREHGQGYDHPGETQVRDSWNAYKLHTRDAALWEEFRKRKW